jgi:hypothetical protein
MKLSKVGLRYLDTEISGVISQAHSEVMKQKIGEDVEVVKMHAARLSSTKLCRDGAEANLRTAVLKLYMDGLIPEAIEEPFYTDSSCKVACNYKISKENYEQGFNVL